MCILVIIYIIIINMRVLGLAWYCPTLALKFAGLQKLSYPTLKYEKKPSFCRPFEIDLSSIPSQEDPIDNLIHNI